VSVPSDVDLKLMGPILHQDYHVTS